MFSRHPGLTVLYAWKYEERERERVNVSNVLIGFAFFQNSCSCPKVWSSPAQVCCCHRKCFNISRTCFQDMIKNK